MLVCVFRSDQILPLLNLSQLVKSARPTTDVSKISVLVSTCFLQLMCAASTICNGMWAKLDILSRLGFDTLRHNRRFRGFNTAMMSSARVVQLGFIV